jgi:uncharacterized repeat protein (TIGR03803 family)
MTTAMNKNGWKEAGLVFFLLSLSVATTQGQTFKTLVNFDGSNGEEPFFESLVQGKNGNLFGTTEYGGKSGCYYQECGAVFMATLNGTLYHLTFCAQPNCTDGANPLAGLILGNDGNFYGTTAFGGEPDCAGDNGCGTVFKIDPEGHLTTLHVFDNHDGYAPYAPLTLGVDGNLYGTTEGGGTDGQGEVFTMDLNGKLTTLHSFELIEGSEPMDGLLLANDGNFYGTARDGGTHGWGSVFKITQQGKLTIIHNFCIRRGCPDGSTPTSGLIQANDGSLYGTTSAGGDSACSSGWGCGTVFRITPDGQFTTFHVFVQGTDGSDPGGLIQATDGNLYGVTAGGIDGPCNCGTIYRLTLDGTLATLYAFDGAEGSAPLGSLFQHTNGVLYGTTYQGGSFSCEGHGCGTVFSFDVGLAPFIRLVQNWGRVGQTGGILGEGFTGTTSIALNGVPAAFTVVSDTYMTATVPSGATSGYVTVMTPGGTLTSDKPFIVLP